MALEYGGVCLKCEYDLLTLAGIRLKSAWWWAGIWCELGWICLGVLRIWLEFSWSLGGYMLESCCKLYRFFLDVFSNFLKLCCNSCGLWLEFYVLHLAGSLLEFRRHSVVFFFWRFDVVEICLEFVRFFVDSWKHSEVNSLEISGTVDWRLVGIWFQILWNLDRNLVDFR